MENRKSDPNPKPDPAPAAAKEKEQGQEAAASQEAEDDEEEEFVDREDDEDDEEEDDDEEEFEHVSEFADPPRNPRTPFTSLSQVDADLALARTLQEQERAYMMLTRGVGGGGGGGRRESVGSESGSEYAVQYDEGVDGDDGIEDHSSVGDDSDYEEDAFDAQDPAAGVDADAFDDDEAYARALQDAEEREVAARLMAFAGINDWVAEDARDYAHNTQDTWSEVDPDELSYEELVALGEAVGTASRGLTADTIASLPSVSYKVQNAREGSNDQCVICRLDYEDGDSLILLACKHMYHPECINKWLQINKVCPICNTEVSTSEHR